MKDKRISQLFDDYANELPQQNNLTDKAAAKIVKQKPKRKMSVFFARFGGICAAVLVCVVCLSIFLPLLQGKNDKNNYDGAEVKPFKIYAASDVQSVRVSETSNLNEKLSDTGLENVKALFDIDEVYDVYGIEQVSKIKYVADYFIGDKTLARVTATYRVYDKSLSSFCDVTVVAETDGFVNNLLLGRYTSSRRYSVSSIDEEGEFVAEGKCDGANGMHFYVFAYGPNELITSTTCQKIFGILQKV